MIATVQNSNVINFWDVNSNFAQKEKSISVEDTQYCVKWCGESDVAPKYKVNKLFTAGYDLKLYAWDVREFKLHKSSESLLDVCNGQMDGNTQRPIYSEWIPT